MKRKYVTLLLLQGFFSFSCQAAIISHDNKASLTGDKLLQFTKALWVAEQNNLRFKFNPFNLSNRLNTHNSNEVTENISGIKKIEDVKSESQIDPKANVVYLISYYFKAQQWGHWLEVTSWKGIWDNEEFRDKLRSFISPNFEIPKLELPKGRIHVALHVRKGGGVGHPLFSERSTEIRQTYADKIWPIKFPPDEYYIEQIKRMSDLLDNKPMHVQIFTDDPNPRRLITKYSKAANKSNITFGAREVGNTIKTNILEDLFTMTTFDYFIRGGSNFAQIIHLLGKFKICIYPRSAAWHGNTMKLDVAIINNTIRSDGSFTLDFDQLKDEPFPMV